MAAAGMILANSRRHQQRLRRNRLPPEEVHVEFQVPVYPSDEQSIAKTCQETPLQSAWAWFALLFGRMRKDALYQGPGLDQIMPTELLLAISAYLTMVDRAVLSLTSMRMWAIFGENNFLLSLPSQKKLELLTLLERDADEHKNGNVLCRPCQIFHDPYLSIPTAYHSSTGAKGSGYNRPCLQEPANPHQRLVSPYLHRTLHFNVLKHLQADKRSKVNLYGPDQLYLVDSVAYCHESVKATVEEIMTCRISTQGELLVKTVTDLSATRNDVPYLYQVLERNNLIKCCGHMYWAARYPFIFQHNMQYYTDPVDLARYRREWESDDLKRIRNIWHPGEEPQHSMDNRHMRACAFCYTNYTYEWRDVDGNRIVRLISYKNLGKGEDMNDVKWASHFKYRACSREDIIRLHWWEGFGSTYTWVGPGESEIKA
ncbi:hypothetical protein CMEL01_13299 [Colletotrichum melonis]|uniref:F-box domain-containing protein n=1 Tax=Colletotrichum melonis TaxID=1209925 RepID=A0AAI9UW91_9PEZI|nr:hypothetical protein CMEL01_13299 [Colletotrichum melonis]